MSEMNIDVSTDETFNISKSNIWKHFTKGNERNKSIARYNYYWKYEEDDDNSYYRNAKRISSYDSSDLSFDHDIYNEIQIENKKIDILRNENICRYDILKVKDRNVDYQEKEYNDSNYEKEEKKEEEEEKNELKLSQKIEFIIWEIAESYFNEYAK
ncbi:hypothetical protein C1645_835842 [Glomus cerebriforme]|uniref:Uncharacterized protein n=1 Tax=Glomus cerebriforme TaxID=658196 RepID=A0A397S9G8_9GLOM|nr:hypothetical protein C1645_835842 [Glomus cerebriforme]